MEGAQHIESLVEALGGYVWLLAPDGAIVYANRLARGAARVVTEHDGQRLDADWDWAGADETAGVRRAVEHARGGAVLEDQRMLRDELGEQHRVQLRMAPLRDAEGQMTGLLATATPCNNSAHPTAPAPAELARAARAKDAVLAVWAHDFRTPLGTILGWAEMARRRPDRPEIVGEALEVIERNARVQKDLVSDLLDLCRLLSGLISVTPQPVPAHALLAELLDAMRAEAATRNIQLEAELAREAVILGDAARLRQAFAALLRYALKVTPDGGRVAVQLSASGPAVEVVVEEAGLTVGPDHAAALFDPMHAADVPAARRKVRCDLGLALARGLVELHGGTLAVTPADPPPGNRFTVRLAATGTPAPAQDETVRRANAPREPLQGVRVLVVEDEPDAREFVRRLLVAEGAEVRTAGGGAEALDALRRDDYALLLSDIGMPGMDGYELIRRVRAAPNPHLRELPAMAVTAFARSEDRDRVLAAGFQAHLPKPVDPDRLVNTAAQLARRRRA